MVGIRPPPSRVLLIMHGISNFLMLTKVWVRKGGHCSALLSLCVTSPSLNCEAFLTNLSLLPTETPQLSVLLPFSHEQKSLFQVGLIKMPCWGFQILLFSMACPTHPCYVPPKLCFFDLNLWNPQNPFVLHLASFRFPEKQNKKPMGEIHVTSQAGKW